MEAKPYSPWFGGLCLFNALIFAWGVWAFPQDGLNRFFSGALALGWLLWGVSILAQRRKAAWARRLFPWALWLLLGSGLGLMGWNVLKILRG